MKRKKISIGILIVGIVFLVLAPILGYFTAKTTLVSGTPTAINEYSSTGIKQAFAYRFSIQSNQKVRIDFSVYFANITATLKIFGNGYYDQQYALNNSPAGMNGLDFVYSQYAYGQNPTASTDDVRTITYDGHYHIEFGGATSGNLIISIPGTYVIVVYGDNDGPAADVNVYFNIVIKIDGPGEFLENLFYYIGTGIILAAILFISSGYYKKFKGGR